jgi:hypothetical protein
VLAGVLLAPTLTILALFIAYPFLLGIWLAVSDKVVDQPMLLPWIVPTVLSTLACQWMFDATYSVFNWVLLNVGLISKRILWLGDGTLAMRGLIASIRMRARGRPPSTAAKRSGSVRMRCAISSPPRPRYRFDFPSCARRCQYGPWLASPLCGVDRVWAFGGQRMPPRQARGQPLHPMYAPYAPGTLRDVSLMADDKIEFSFFGGDRWRLTILQPPRRVMDTTTIALVRRPPTRLLSKHYLRVERKS